MLAPGRVLPALPGPFKCLFSTVAVMHKQYTAAAACYNPTASKAQNTVVSKASCLLPFISGSQRFRRIFYQQGSMLLADFFNFINLPRKAIKMGIHNQLHIRKLFKGNCKDFRVHIPVTHRRINKNRFTALVKNRSCHRCRRKIRTEYAPAL